MVRKISGLYKEILHGGGWQTYKKVNPETGRLKTYKKYVGRIEKMNERCVRVFASKDPADGMLQKVHKNGSISKLEGTPEHSFIYNDEVNGVRCSSKLDKQWYIDLARKRIGGFGI